MRHSASLLELVLVNWELQLHAREASEVTRRPVPKFVKRSPTDASRIARVGPSALVGPSKPFVATHLAWRSSASRSLTCNAIPSPIVVYDLAVLLAE